MYEYSEKHRAKSENLVGRPDDYSTLYLPGKSLQRQLLPF